MFDLGIQELIVIFVVALLVFGPKRLPELGKSLGKGLAELRRAMEGVKEQIHAESEMISSHNEDFSGSDKKIDTDSEKDAGQKPASEKTEEIMDVKTPGERKEDSSDGR